MRLGVHLWCVHVQSRVWHRHQLGLGEVVSDQAERQQSGSGGWRTQSPSMRDSANEDKEDVARYKRARERSFEFSNVFCSASF
jgi:hypothetical protein